MWTTRVRLRPIVDATTSIRIEPIRFVDFVAGSAAFVQEYFDHAGNGPFLPDAHLLTPSGEWQIGVDIFQRGVVDAGVRWVTPLLLPLARQEDRTVLQMP